jgi:hypothetical protein
MGDERLKLGPGQLPKRAGAERDGVRPRLQARRKRIDGPLLEYEERG